MEDPWTDEEFSVTVYIVIGHIVWMGYNAVFIFTASSPYEPKECWT
jgi:hypothetical protein